MNISISQEVSRFLAGLVKDKKYKGKPLIFCEGEEISGVKPHVDGCLGYLGYNLGKDGEEIRVAIPEKIEPSNQKFYVKWIPIAQTHLPHILN